MEKQKMIRKWRFDAVDIFVVILLTFWMFLIIIPFVNAISISFATQKEYVDNPLMLFPSQPTLQSYEMPVSYTHLDVYKRQGRLDPF